MANSITPQEIQNWFPRSLDEFVGSKNAIKAFKQHYDAKGRGGNILLSGETGTGKTVLINAYLRILLCDQANDVGHRPCGKCSGCKGSNRYYSDHGLFAHIKQGRIINTFRFNGSQFDRDTLAELRSNVGDSPECLNIIVLDEIQELAGKPVECSLLTSMAEMNAVWIAAGTQTSRLRPELVRRFAVRPVIANPDEVVLALWLRERAMDWKVIPEDDSVLPKLAHKCGGIISESLSVMVNAASGRSRVLTHEMINSHSYIRGRQTP